MSTNHATQPYRRAKERLPSQEELHRLLELRDGGLLYWKPRPMAYFKDERAGKIWNTRFSWKPALTALTDGYRTGWVLNVPARAQWVVFKMVYGYEPIMVDHEDGNRSNNDPSNLRAADRSLNMKNVRRSGRNKSGHCGVCWDKARGKWLVQISLGGKRTKVGLFVSLTDAVSARKAAEAGQGFTERHGALP